MIIRLEKMRVANDEEVKYFLSGENEEIPLHDMLDRTLNMEFGGKISCVNCDRVIRKTFQGLCFQCFTDAPEAAPCIIRPELCEAHLGQGRDVEWEVAHHHQPHVVYLAFSGGLKVGVTRASNSPNRWIDQGATQAIVLAETPYRQLAGQIEVELKQFISDKTDWRKMLVNDAPEVDLVEQKEMLGSLLSSHLIEYVSPNNTIFHFHYPVLKYPQQVSSIRLDKTRSFAYKLVGIKGQYLIFDTGKVFNVRNHCGYHVSIEA